MTAQEDEIIRLFLRDVQISDNATASSLSSVQTASLLYRSGQKRAAKELLCEQRAVYEAFRRTGTPCGVRASWELKDTLSLRPMANASNGAAAFQGAPAFGTGGYKSHADCLTAAYSAGVPLSSCNGR